MFKSSKRIVSFGACAVALGILALTAPKAAHAFAATLVQVTNTALNPVVAQSPTTQASQLINLGAQGNGVLFLTRRFIRPLWHSRRPSWLLQVSPL